MARRGEKQRVHPFPEVLPEIRIAPSRAKPFAVDLRELPGCFTIPQVGQQTLWSIYDPPDWTLTEVTEVHAVRPARVHGIDCVELELTNWVPRKGWLSPDCLMYARLTEDKVQCVANHRLVEGKRVLYTFLDGGFDVDWGEMPRHLTDRGRFVLQKDGSYKQRKSLRPRSLGALGAGVFRVRIGPKTFICLRILENGEKADDKDTLAELYVTRAGRTVLFRRFNGRQWALRNPAYGGLPWDQRFPDHDRLVIDGVTYVHWYTCLTNMSLGDTRSPLQVR